MIPIFFYDMEYILSSIIYNSLMIIHGLIWIIWSSIRLIMTFMIIILTTCVLSMFTSPTNPPVDSVDSGSFFQLCKWAPSHLLVALCPFQFGSLKPTKALWRGIPQIKRCRSCSHLHLDISSTYSSIWLDGGYMDIRYIILNI